VAAADARWSATLARRGGPLGFALLGSGPWRALFSSSTDCSLLAWTRAHDFQASSGRRGRLDDSHQCRRGARRQWQARAKVEPRLQLEVHLEWAPFSPTQTPPMPSRRRPLAPARPHCRPFASPRAATGHLRRAPAVSSRPATGHSRCTVRLQDTRAAPARRGGEKSLHVAMEEAKSGRCGGVQDGLLPRTCPPSPGRCRTVCWTGRPASPTVSVSPCFGLGT